MNTLRSYASTLLRMGISLIIIWFGSQQLLHPQTWTHFLPGWTSDMFLSQVSFVYLNGAFEVIAGALLFLGLFTCVVSFLLALHMLSIVITVGYNPTGMRDLAIFFAVAFLFLHKNHDKWSLDKKLDTPKA